MNQRFTFGKTKVKSHEKTTIYIWIAYLFIWKSTDSDYTRR
jgi:hypothetical protein